MLEAMVSTIPTADLPINTNAAPPSLDTELLELEKKLKESAERMAAWEAQEKREQEATEKGEALPGTWRATPAPLSSGAPPHTNVALGGCAPTGEFALSMAQCEALKPNVPLAFLRTMKQQERDSSAENPAIPAAFRNRSFATAKQGLAVVSTVSTPSLRSDVTLPIPHAGLGAVGTNTSVDGGFGRDVFSNASQMGAGVGAWQGLPTTGMWPAVGLIQDASAAMHGSVWHDPRVNQAANAMSNDVTAEQAVAIHDAVVATQQAQYMQQVQFLQQVREQSLRATQAGQGGESRFRDDYRPFRLCRHFMTGECWQGSRCVYAHCFEELHPASPDLPKDADGTEIAALAEQKSVTPQQESKPNMRLRKKRDLCRKFTETGKCVRGAACPNAHGEAEIGQMAFVLYDKVKLQLCNHWERGRCSYGDNCIHAHGDQEIGQKRREFYDIPPVKRRRDGETIEEWRASILKDPGPSTFHTF